MCLIVCKPEGVSAPTKADITRWCKIHPDGFGMTFTDTKGRIRILKGAMCPNEAISMHKRMIKMIKPLTIEQVNVIYHFRMATEGTVKPSNCHPFPITTDGNKLRSTELITDKAVAHNGMIYHYARYNTEKKKYTFNDKDDTTDTQKFIVDFLAGMGTAIYNSAVQEMITEFTDSKFAVLSDRGITMIGNFIQDKGLYYSNNSYTQHYQYEWGWGGTNYTDYTNYKCNDSYLLSDGKQADNVMEYCDFCNMLVYRSELREFEGLQVCDFCYKHTNNWIIEDIDKNDTSGSINVAGKSIQTDK